MNKDQINRWKTLANKELKDKTIDSLNWLTPEDITIKPLYTENDLENISHPPVKPNPYVLLFLCSTVLPLS